jgi:putative DNA primase/helicase
VNAAAVAAGLGNVRREGRAWRCRCPLHGGRSLVLRDGDNGRLLITCWAGCNRLDLLTELRRRGLLDVGHGDGRHRDPRDHKAPCGDYARRAARALAIFGAGREGAGTIVARYLASRGLIFGDWPPSLRFHPRCPRPRDDAGNLLPPLPAMVALVEHVERGPVAVHRTYLRPDGSSKAALPKEQQRASLGRIGGGAVRLAKPRAGEWLLVGEGIESTAAAMVSCNLPGWAALSANGIRSLVLPPEVTAVIIIADHDLNGVGQRAAYDAAARWLAEDRRVRIALPPKPDTDFADVLCGHVPTKIKEKLDVA